MADQLVVSGRVCNFAYLEQFIKQYSFNQDKCVAMIIPRRIFFVYFKVIHRFYLHWCVSLSNHRHCNDAVFTTAKPCSVL